MTLSDIPASVDVTAGADDVHLNGYGVIASGDSVTISLTNLGGILESRRTRLWNSIKHACASGALSFDHPNDALGGSLREKNISGAPALLDGLPLFATGEEKDVELSDIPLSHRHILTKSLENVDTGVIAPVNRSTENPVFTSITPATGTHLGGTPVVIVGVGFLPATTVTVGGNLCTSIVFVDEHTLHAVTAAHAAGVNNVVVDNGGGHTVTGTGAFTFT
jgi:hypothetical protein